MNEKQATKKRNERAKRERGEKCISSSLKMKEMNCCVSGSVEEREGRREKCSNHAFTPG